MAGEKTVLVNTPLNGREGSVISAPVWNMLNEQAMELQGAITGSGGVNIKNIALIALAAIAIMFIVKKVS